MSRAHTISPTFTLHKFISKVITPVVLLSGLLVLLIYNFNTVLKSVDTQSDQYHEMVSFSQSSLKYTFHESTGLDRPNIAFNGNELLSYAEWSSTISVDGDVQELWNDYHGYSVDDANQQMYNTISGGGWQLIEIVTLVNDHTVTVTFNLVTRPQSTPPPAHFIFQILHTHDFWYNEQVHNNIFTAQVATSNSANVQNAQLQYKPKPLGTISLALVGEAAHDPLISFTDSHNTTGSNGKLSWTKAMVTEYKIDNPPSFQMLTLGTETITFQPAPTSPNQPIGSALPAA